MKGLKKQNLLKKKLNKTSEPNKNKLTPKISDNLLGLSVSREKRQFSKGCIPSKSFPMPEKKDPTL